MKKVKLKKEKKRWKIDRKMKRIEWKNRIMRIKFVSDMVLARFIHPIMHIPNWRAHRAPLYEVGYYSSFAAIFSITTVLCPQRHTHVWPWAISIVQSYGLAVLIPPVNDSLLYREKVWTSKDRRWAERRWGRRYNTVFWWCLTCGWKGQHSSGSEWHLGLFHLICLMQQTKSLWND